MQQVRRPFPVGREDRECDRLTDPRGEDLDMCLPSSETSASAIDLDELLVRCLGNLEFAERILAMFQERFDADLEEMERLAREGDAVNTARLAHRLKGASANASASGLQTRVAEIEQLARQGDLGTVRPRLDDLQREWEIVKQSLPLVGSAVSFDT